MTYKTHIAGSIALAATTTTVFHVYEPTSLLQLSLWGVAYIVPSMLGSIVPDIDHFNSKISNHNIFTKIIAILVRIFCGRRGMIHSPFFFILLSCFLGMIYWIYAPHSIVLQIIMGFLLGYLSHLLLDFLNPGGLPLLFPFVWKDGRPKRYHPFNIPEDGIFEFLIWLLLMIVIIIMVQPQLVKFL